MKKIRTTATHRGIKIQETQNRAENKILFQFFYGKLF